MEHDYLIRTELPPRVTDAAIAMRVSSFVVFLASIWFAATPIAYYWIPQNDSASFNFAVVGGILICTSLLRLWLPLYTVGLSWLNVVLGIWGFISPWVFGFSRLHKRPHQHFVFGCSHHGYVVHIRPRKRIVGKPDRDRLRRPPRARRSGLRLYWA